MLYRTIHYRVIRSPDSSGVGTAFPPFPRLNSLRQPKLLRLTVHLNLVPVLTPPLDNANGALATE